MIRLTLSYPPQTNHMYTVARGRKIKSGKYREWLDNQGWAVAHQFMLSGQSGLPGKFRVRFGVERPDRRRRDLDNLLKPLMDALVKGGAIADDSNAESISISWMPREGNPPVVHVEIEEI